MPTLKNLKMKKILNFVIRVVLIICSYELIESGFRLFFVPGFAFSGDMPHKKLITLLIWGVSYFLLGFVGLFTAFKLHWLHKFIMLSIASLGIVVSIWNLLSVSAWNFTATDCSEITHNPFMLLSCSAHPAEYFGLFASILLAVSIFLPREDE